MTDASARVAAQGLPRFSIFIPVYNDGRWLSGAIESVLAQTYPHWELIVGDNVSEDDLAAIVARFPDERIRYQRWTAHTDFVDNHNRTIQLCRYEWLQLLSADDRLHPDCLARMTDRIGEVVASRGQPPAMVLTSCRPVDESGQPAPFAFSHSWRVKHIPDGLYHGRDWLRLTADPGQIPWNVGSLAISRDVYSVLGGFFRTEIGLAVDVEMSLRASAYGMTAYIDESLLDYTVRAGSINRELSRRDRAYSRVTTLGAALLSGLALHEKRYDVTPDERGYVLEAVAGTHVGRALQHRYLPGGLGRRGALADIGRAFLYDWDWFASPRLVLRAIAALVAPRWVIRRTKDWFMVHRRHF